MGPQPVFEYSVVDDIHCFRLLAATADGVKAMLDHAEINVVEKPINGRNLVLIDFRPAGPPPLTASLPHIVSFLSRQPRRTPQPVRIAYIYTRGSHGRILNIFLSLQRLMPLGMVSKFFSEAEYTEAIEWLHVG